MSPKSLIVLAFIASLHGESRQENSGSPDRGVYQKREHSLSKPYGTISGFGGGASLWDFGGSTMITGSHIRVTSDRKAQSGFIWNNVPTSFKNWELHLHFRIKSAATSMAGDGLALWYTKTRMAPGGVFGSANGFAGLGVFLDTFANDQSNAHKYPFPHINAMVSDGQTQYDHTRDGETTAVGGCSAQLRNRDHDTFLLIRYEKRRLTVKKDVEDQRRWQECFTADGVKLPSGFFFGVSAATGDLTDNHDVVSLKVYELDAVDGDADDDDEEVGLVEPLEDVKEVAAVEEVSRVSNLFYWLVVVVLLLLLAFGVYVYMVDDKRDSKKRFY